MISKSSWLKKATLVLLCVYAIYALVVIYSGKVEDINLTLYVISLISAVLFAIGIGMKLNLDRREVILSEANVEAPTVLDAMQYKGMLFGFTLMGGIKFRKSNDTWVSYTFFSIILPLIPTGCYRVKALDSENGIFMDTQNWRVDGSEKMDVKEILSIYLILYGFIVWAITALVALGL